MAKVTTLIFDIDDTMYPVSSGFSEHRNGEIIADYMVEKLGFKDRKDALDFRTPYFQKYHSTVRGLKEATKEGTLAARGCKDFDEQECANYWAEHCKFTTYLKSDPVFIELLKTYRDSAGLKLVAFSNSPHKYALHCLDAMGVKEFFPEEHVFGVDDMKGHCKPDKEAFDQVLSSVGATYEEAVMFEDSMKNVRACNAIGIKTVLIFEKFGEQNAADGSEAKLLNDAPLPDDPSVGAVVRNINELGKALPELKDGIFKEHARPRVPCS